jgi:CDP-paratose 2-epimerase
MKVMITGSGGLVGSEAALYFGERGCEILGIDNDGRADYFGDEASVQKRLNYVKKVVGKQYEHHDAKIESRYVVDYLVKYFMPDVIIHCAAQPSHDWAARAPFVDFDVNAVGTLNLLEAARKYVPECVFVFTSTNKVYGDTPNRIKLVEKKTRYEPRWYSKYYHGINEKMSIDQTKHSIFGASKVAADVMVQEYGRYFDMKTVCFRCGCITGPSHQGAELHGFLAYLMKCAKKYIPFTIYGYKGKQVRDNIHALDLVSAFDYFIKDPKPGAVYNMGGGRMNSCSVLEAIGLCESIVNRRMDWELSPINRVGDHQWWITSNCKFELDYPGWRIKHPLYHILLGIYDAL